MFMKICLFLAVLGLVRSSGEEMLHCDFEDGKDCEGWGDTSSGATNSRWVVMAAGNNIRGSPKKDNTIGETGHYLGFAPGKTTREEVEYESPAFSFATDFNDEFCLQFYYFVSGFMGRLRIYHSGSKSGGYTPIGLKSLMAERRKRQWVRYTATVKKKEGETGVDRVVIKASAFWIPSKTGFFAIDDIWISKGSCEDMEKVYMKPSGTMQTCTTCSMKCGSEVLNFTTEATAYHCLFYWGRNYLAWLSFQKDMGAGGVVQPTQPSNDMNDAVEKENARRNREESEKLRKQEEYNKMRNKNPSFVPTFLETTMTTLFVNVTQPIQPAQPTQPAQPIQPDPVVVTQDYRLNNPKFRMCGNTFAKISTEICCRGIPQPIVPNAMCCGPFACNPVVEVCCGEDLFKKSEANMRCCGQHAYDTRTQGCCGGHRVYYLSNLVEQCCGHQLYDATVMSCCGHQIYKNGIKRCCNNAVYNSYWFGCCKGQKYPVRTQQCLENGNIVRRGKVLRMGRQ